MTFGRNAVYSTRSTNSISLTTDAIRPAARYARALFDVAVKEKADLDQIERELPRFADLFAQYPALAAACS